MLSRVPRFILMFVEKCTKNGIELYGKSGNPYEAGTDKTFSLDTLSQEYTAYGNGDYRINGLETEQADGSDTANLKYECYEISKGKYRYRTGHSKKSTGSDQPGWL